MLGKRERRSPDKMEVSLGWYRGREENGGGVGLGIVAALGRRNAASKAVKVTPAAAPPLIFPGRSVEGLFCGVDEEEEDKSSSRHCRNLGSTFSLLRRGSFELPISKTTEFLSSCFLCKKQLHGVDIYMYRGEKAFCSMECRGQQMLAEQLQEKCSSEASMPSSDYAAGELFCAGSASA